MDSLKARIRVLFAGCYLLLHLSQYVLAGCGTMPASVAAIWNPGNLQYVGYTLGILMVIIQGVRYITADSAQERSDVKKGLIYVVIGILVIKGYTSLTDFYCDIAGITYTT